MKRNINKLLGSLLVIVMAFNLLGGVYTKAEDVSVIKTVVDGQETGTDKIIYVGDVDGDGAVTPKDVTKMRRFLAGGWDVEVATEDGDVDGDGSITPKDVTKLRRYLAGGWGIELPEKEKYYEPIIVPGHGENLLGEGKWVIKRIDMFSPFTYTSGYHLWTQCYEVEDVDGDTGIEKRYYIPSVYGDIENMYVDTITRDAKGNIIKESTELYLTMPKLDSYGFEVEPTTVRDRRFASIFLYDYDVDNRIIKKTFVTPEMGLIWYDLYTYDENSCVTVIDKYKNSGERIASLRYSYDATGKLLSETYEYNGVVKEVLIYGDDESVTDIQEHEKTMFITSNDQAIQRTMIRGEENDGQLVYEISNRFSDGLLTQDYCYQGYSCSEINKVARYDREYGLIEYYSLDKNEGKASLETVNKQYDGNNVPVKADCTLRYDTGSGQVKESSSYTREGNSAVYTKNTESYSSKTLYTYNEYDQVVNIDDTFSNSYYDSHKRTYYEYNDAGQLIKISEDQNGILEEKTLYIYDDEGRLSECVGEYDRVTYTYDVQGFMIPKYNGKYTEYHDSEGKIEKLEYLKEGQESKIYQRVYDSEGNIIRQPIYMYSTISRSAFGIADKLVAQSIGIEDSEGKTLELFDGTYTYIYDHYTNGSYKESRITDGFIDKESYYSRDGKLEKEIDVSTGVVTEERSYDADRRLVKTIRRRYYPSSDFLDEYGYGCSYDEYGFCRSYILTSVDEKSFPDSVFRTYIAENIDEDYDGYLSEPELKAVKELNLNGLNVSNLTGLEVFAYLESIDCRNTSLCEIDLGYKQDKVNVLHDNNVKVIYAVPIDKEHFPDEYFRKIISYRYDYNDNGYLDSSELKVESFDISGIVWDDGIFAEYDNLIGIDYFWKLKSIQGGECVVRDVDLSACSELEDISFSEFEFKNMNIQGCKKLKTVDLSEGYIGNKVLSFSQNSELTDINLFEVGSRQIDLSGCTNLKRLIIDDVGIGELDISGCPNLELLKLYGTGVRVIDASHNPLLTLENIDVDYYEDGDDIYPVEIIWN